jgi:hypothetical protein
MGITLHLELPPELERRVVEEAARRGQQPAEFARAVLEEKLAPPPHMERNRRAIALLDQWDAEDAASTEDDGSPPAIAPLSLRGVDVA